MIRSLALVTLCLAGAFAAPVYAKDAPGVSLQHLTWDEFTTYLEANTEAKFILVDAWASNCAPCKENFPHLLEMYEKYGPKGLGVVSLSLDDPEDAKAVADAEKFLIEKKAVFTNILLKEEFGVGYDKLDISSIPAVFLYSADGKLLKRFTMDDPNNQFTYEEVEEDVASRLDVSK